VRAALSTLIERWWLQAPTVDVAIVACSGARAELGDSARYCLRADALWLALFAAEDAALQLAQGWLGCSVPRAGAALKNLERKFVIELFAGLSGCAATPAIEENIAIDALPDIARPGAGGLSIELNIGGAIVNLLTTAALWPALGELPQRSAKLARVTAASALGACGVRLEASLPAVQMSLADVAGLGVGDFLNLQYDLSGQIRLRGADIDVSLPATLGRSGARKAAQIIALTTKEQQTEAKP
jgi:hypothetical protein